MKNYIALVMLLAGCVSAPLPRIESPTEAIRKDCVHLGSYRGKTLADYDDRVIDRWVRSRGGNAVYAFDFDGHYAAANCARL